MNAVFMAEVVWLDHDCFMCKLQLTPFGQIHGAQIPTKYDNGIDAVRLLLLYKLKSDFENEACDF